MEIVVKNCNNIDEGKITIIPEKLNIKFGVNGTGKSTLTRAIKYSIDEPNLLKDLTPFKLRKVDPAIIPSVTISEDLKSVLIFNEDYLNQFLFKEDELIANSYEIFINNEEFKKSATKIDELLSEIKQVFTDSQELSRIIVDFESLSKSFATTQTGLSKSSVLYKGLKEGNRIEHVPEELSGYSKLIKDKSCVKWLDWQNEGAQFLEISDDCPYCTSPTEEKKETIKSVSIFYDKNVVKNFTALMEALYNLGDYLSEEANSTLRSITEKKSGIEPSEMSYIVSVKQQIDDLLHKLKSLKFISALSFDGDEDIAEKLKSFKISIDLFDRFKSEKTLSVIASLNTSLDSLITQIGLLKGEINKQRRLVSLLVKKHKESINSFLTNAGYKYGVEILTDKNGNYKLLLKHDEYEDVISGGRQYLSFGEKNAFAIVLFMYEALHKNPDLIILDDPISSFDKSKKYAIMHMLFRGKSNECLLNKNVVMLTHDLDPVIDTVKVLKEFNNLCNASFLTTKDGALSEMKIQKKDLKSFAQICKLALASDLNEIVKLIYLRRHFEIIDDLGDEYQVLSNLLHRRAKEACRDQRMEIGNDLMSESVFDAGVKKIQEILPIFDYNQLLEKITDDSYLKSLYASADNSYAKLNIFRIIYDETLSKIPSVLRKYINESYHIENELVCQLDPNDYDLVPDFIIKECDRYLSE